MRLIAIGFVALLAVAPASAQGQVNTPHPYGLDPYTPSDAAWLRTYGAALVAQTPMADLATLDPYKPSDAALLRQMGGGMPLCCLDGYWPGLALGSSAPPSLRGVAGMPGVRLAAAEDRRTIVVTAPPAPAATSEPAASAAFYHSWQAVTETVARPASNDGISIRYGGRTWTSAGRAVPRQDLQLERVGEFSGFAVYKRTGTNDDVIYVPARSDMMAPYRLKP